MHAFCAFKLWARNQGARSYPYSYKKAVAATISSRTMRWGGVSLLLFVIFHLLHLTTRTITPGGDSDSPYQRMVNGFQPEQWYVVVIYLARHGGARRCTCATGCGAPVRPSA